MSVSEHRSRSGVVGMGRSKVRVDSHVAIVGPWLGNLPSGKGPPTPLFLDLGTVRPVYNDAALGDTGYTDENPVQKNL